MNNKDFQEILERRLLKIEEVLVYKAKEYAQDGDRLNNFKVAGRIQNESPAKALWGMAVKHLVSIEDIIEGRLSASDGIVDEKIGDMINYLILLEAVLKEITNKNKRASSSRLDDLVR